MKARHFVAVAVILSLLLTVVVIWISGDSAGTSAGASPTAVVVTTVPETTTTQAPTTTVAPTTTAAPAPTTTHVHPEPAPEPPPAPRVQSTPAPAPPAPPAPVPAPAPVGGIEGIIRAAAAEFGVSGDTMMRIARCESGLNPSAVNSSSGALGLFQHMPQYWGARAAGLGYGYASWSDPTANARVSAKMMAQEGLSPWSCA